MSKTRLHQLRESAIDQCFQLLMGEPYIDNEGKVVMMDGKPLMKPPSPAALNVVRQLLKDNGIDREPVDVPAKPITEGLPFAEPEERDVLEATQPQRLTGPEDLPFDE